MSVEQGNTIADLVVANPLVEDKVHEGPNHFWLLKRVLKNVFPGAGGQGFNKPILAKEDDLNCIEGCSTNEPDGANWRLKNFVVNIKTAINILNDRVTAIESGGIGQAAWPVGSIFISYSDQNPAVLLGFGTWTRTAGGKVIVGVDANDPDFSTPGKIGGQKNLDLRLYVRTKQTDQSPIHTHTYYSPGGGALQTAQAGSHNHDFVVTEPDPVQTNGSVQPYITAYIWKRDA